MTKDEALQILDIGVKGELPSRLNRGLTQTQASDIVRKGLQPAAFDHTGHLKPLYEKRVYQVALDMKRPSEQAKMVIRIEALNRKALRA